VTGLPIAEHGLVGDLRSAALVGTDGTVDWFCPGRFDAPSAFAALLDGDRGGHWSMAPTCEVASRSQFYHPESAVLVTRFLTEHGIVECQDFMPVGDGPQRLVRRVVGVRGEVGMRTDVVPRPGYARERAAAKAVPGGTWFTGDDLALALGASVPLTTGDAEAGADFTISAGDTALFVLAVHARDEDPSGDDLPDDLAPTGVDELFEATLQFWRDWLASSTYTGRWREMVQRSAITLKLLTHEPSGAIVAAPTMGLPEEIGGQRNWDYRYVWLRDAAFSLYALLRMGFTREAGAFVGWLTDRFVEPRDGERGPLRVMYTIDGDPPPPEVEQEQLAGYRGSAPVLVGNGAGDQLQLDVYGEIIDSVYLFDKHGDGISHDDWQNLCAVIDWLRDHWDQADEGIWETRGGRGDHVYSRLMCWVALERMIRMARKRGLPGDLTGWTTTRDEIYHQIMDRGWDADRGTFVQRYDADTLDASVLLMPMVKFVAPTEPRFLSTLAAIERDLVVDTLVFRYDVDRAPDGIAGEEGTFSMCSFWYVEALTRAGRLREARVALEKMFTYANHLGLYAEEIGLTGDQLGNFPQAFTHLSLISAAINLDRALG
jgi:GH15 family glucan-1,4-alpha-glucosidase